MAKRIQLSSDNITYYTLPGNSGELSNEAGQLPDTIFGASFESNFPGLIEWSVQANGIFKGFAGYQVGLRISGAPIAITAEPMTLVSGKTYQVTAPTKRILSMNALPLVYANAVLVPITNIANYDLLFGRITFEAAYTPTGPITISGFYVPTTVIGGSRSFTLTQTANALDMTTIPEAQANAGHKLFSPGLRTVSMDLTGIYALSNDFRSKLIGRTEFIVEICPDNTNLAVARGVFRFTTQNQSGDVGDLEEETIALTLSVPALEKLKAPFSWLVDATSTLSPALKVALNAWQDEVPLHIRYLPDATGVRGQGIVTDFSLAGGLEAMNEFTVNVQGTNGLTAFP